MKNVDLQVGAEVIHPGESVSLALPLPEMFSRASLYMPIKVLHGKRAGPCLLVIAAMRGDELNGTEIINRLLNHTGVQRRLLGTLIAVPVLNVCALINRSRYLPGGIDLDRCFPGSQHGTQAARTAYLFSSQLFRKADYCIDLQTGFSNYTSLPQVYVEEHDEASMRMAQAFNALVVSNMIYEEGSLSTFARQQNTPFLRYEGGEAMRFDEYAIKIGLKGILNVMRKLKMLPVLTTKSVSPIRSFFAEKSVWVCAPTSGISYSKLKLGQLVKKGELVSVIKDPFSASDNARVISPQEGIIVAKNNVPFVYEGEALFQFAIFDKVKQVALQLKDWREHSHQSETVVKESTVE